jgi:pyruvate kinase
MDRQARMRRNRNTKILATLGPASSDEAMISKLFEAGVDVFRFNFSHGTHEEHKKRLQIIRNLEKKFSRPIGILQDLQGPKLRVGKFASKWVDLKQGADFRLDLKEELTYLIQKFLLLLSQIWIYCWTMGKLGFA